jgi:hypothetical protein
MFGKEWIDNAGTLYCVDGSLKVAPKLYGVTISNGLVWDGSIMYYIDTMTFNIDAFDFNAEEATISNRRAVFSFPSDQSMGFPDGMTMDTDGNLWVAMFNVRHPYHSSYEYLYYLVLLAGWPCCANQPYNGCGDTGAPHPHTSSHLSGLWWPRAR